MNKLLFLGLSSNRFKINYLMIIVTINSKGDIAESTCRSDAINRRESEGKKLKKKNSPIKIPIDWINLSWSLSIQSEEQRNKKEDTNPILEVSYRIWLSELTPYKIQAIWWKQYIWYLKGFSWFPDRVLFAFIIWGRGENQANILQS